MKLLSINLFKQNQKLNKFILIFFNLKTKYITHYLDLTIINFLNISLLKFILMLFLPKKYFIFPKAFLLQ